MMTHSPNDFVKLLDEFRKIGVDPELLWQWANQQSWRSRRNREQAAASFPVFAYLLAANPDIPVHMEITAAIDRGDRLIERLSDILNVKKRVVRFLRGMGPAMIGQKWLEHPSELLEAIELLPNERLPQNSEAWMFYREFWVEMGMGQEEGYLIRNYHSPANEPMIKHVLIGICSIGYEASARRMRKLWRGSLRGLGGLKDYYSYVAKWCKSGVGLGRRNDRVRAMSESIRDRFLQRYSAMELIRQSEQWHREINGQDYVRPISETSEQLQDWPPLPGLPRTIGNLVLVSLTNPTQLQIEGSRLNHCVGSYYDLCMYGESHIVSIRNADDESLSTAEIYFHDDEHGNLRPQVVQHQAYENTEPDRKCKESLAEMLRILRNDAIQPQLREIREFHLERREKMGMLFSIDDDCPSAAQMSEVMSRILPDFSKALIWLDRHLNEMEDWCCIQNHKVGEKLRNLGFGDELTVDRAFEVYLETGIDVLLDETIKINW